jgi:hypothetical protein
MQRVLDSSAWIGNAIEARDAITLIEHGFNAVIDLALDELAAQLPRELIHLRFPIIDGAGNDENLLAATIKTTAMMMQLPGLNIAVCCSAGLSRSPAIVAAAISLVKNQPVAITLTEMASQVRCDISPALWLDVSAVCKTMGNKE